VTHLFHGLQWDEESGLYFISVGKLGGVFGKIKHSPLLKKLGPAAQEPTCLDPNTGSTLSRTYAMPHVFDQKGRAYAGNNPWSLKQEEGGRHAPFQNRIASFFDIWTELSAARIIIADNGVKPGSVNRAAGGPGGAHLGSVNVKLIVPVAMDKGLRFGVLKTRHDTVKNTIQNVR
jgi:hypothetical protein